MNHEVNSFQQRSLLVPGAVFGRKRRLCLEVKFGFIRLPGNFEPYFTITGTAYSVWTQGKRRCVIRGCLHKEIETFFPELKPLITWHLMPQCGLPADVSRLIYLFDLYEKRQTLESLYAFKSAARIGVLPGDTINDFTLMATEKEDMAACLNNRVPALNALFRATMVEFGVRPIVEGEISDWIAYDERLERPVFVRQPRRVLTLKEEV